VRTGGTSMPWLYSYATGDAQWQWGTQQIDPISGELVVLPTAEKPAEPANDSAPEESPDEKPPADPEQQPDKNGLLPHSRLGGNTASPLTVGGFSSNHQAGVNFAFGDGSVRFITDDASAGLMGRLANRADGQIVDGKELP
jgi:prepilin-type processing-associated H-X9-DG protein